MLTVRPGQSRGRTALGWLDSYHTFSFGDYHDPEQIGFQALRVINDDRVAPGTGFGMHPHRDMEILTWVLAGALEHRDSLGNGSVIEPGQLQRMSAGTGILHSEYNPSESDLVHLLQIWILPERRGLTPGYEQRTFPATDRRGRLQLLAARDGRAGAVTVHQDVELYVADLAASESVTQPLKPGRSAWVQVTRGTVQVNGRVLRAGDGAAVRGERDIRLEASGEASLLLFDLA
jgi:redox-sensitive bicupin YhaK (pirin superfamily)